MGAQCVLDGEVMQTEALLHRAQQWLIRLVQTDPDEAAVGGVNVARLIEIDVRNPASPWYAAQLITMPCLASSGSGRSRTDASYISFISTSL
jgi:hypothetical protein